MLIQIIIGVILAIIAIDLSLRIYYGRMALKLLDRMPPFRVESVPPQKQAIPFEVTTEDELTLRGSIHYPESSVPQGVVIFCPETLSNHWSAVRYCQGLLDSGFLVVSFDFRNQGESDHLSEYESLHWVTAHETNDLKAVVKWVQEQEAFADLPIGLFGISRGGSAALIVGTEMKEIQAICSDSGYTNDLLLRHYANKWIQLVVPVWLTRLMPSMWHVYLTMKIAFWCHQFQKSCRYLNKTNPFGHLADKQVFLIAGERDSYVPVSISQHLLAMLGHESAQLWLVSNAAHNGARNQHPEEYDHRLSMFFRQMLQEVPETEVPAEELLTVVQEPQKTLVTR